MTQQEQNLTKTEKVKEHFKNHKEKYIVGGFGVALGVGVGFVIGHRAPAASANQKVVALKTGDVTQNVTQIVSRRGHPGTVIRCVETGEQFASIKRASELLGVSQRGISECVKGLRPSVKGLTFESLGDAVNVA